MAREALPNPRQAQTQRKTTFKDTFPHYSYREQDVLNGSSIQPSSLPCLDAIGVSGSSLSG